MILLFQGLEVLVCWTLESHVLQKICKISIDLHVTICYTLYTIIIDTLFENTSLYDNVFWRYMYGYGIRYTIKENCNLKNLH